jgi:hypothetical protein
LYIKLFYPKQRTLLEHEREDAEHLGLLAVRAVCFYEPLHFAVSENDGHTVAIQVRDGAESGAAGVRDLHTRAAALSALVETET